MIITYAAQALADLDDIAVYLEARNPAAAVRVGTAIRDLIDGLALHPMRGRRQDLEGVRKVVEPTFGYLIFYHLDTPERSITILAVRHHARERPFEDL